MFEVAMTYMQIHILPTCYLLVESNDGIIRRYVTSWYKLTNT